MSAAAERRAGSAHVRRGGATATRCTRRPTPRAATSATARSACVSARGRTSAAATVSTIALRRRDDLAPAARRQRRAHPRQQPLAGDEQVARRPDREHPRAVRGGDVDAEGEDQERVDLAVEARAQRGRRPGAPRHPSVDRVQRERDGGERHEQRDRRVVRERVRDQRGDADGERGPGERHPRRRPQPAHRARARAPPRWSRRRRRRRPSPRRRARWSPPGRTSSSSCCDQPGGRTRLSLVRPKS